MFLRPHRLRNREYCFNYRDKRRPLYIYIYIYIYIYTCKSVRKMLVIFTWFYIKREYVEDFSIHVNIQDENFIKIRLAVVAVFHANGQTWQRWQTFCLILLPRRLSSCGPVKAVANRHRTDSSPSESLSPGLKQALHFTFPVHSRCPNNDVHIALHADSRRQRTDIVAGTWRALHQPCVYSLAVRSHPQSL